MKMRSLLIFVVLLFIIAASKVACIRVENLAEINKDSTSITIKWTIPVQLLPTSSSGANDWVGYKIKYSRDDDNAITLNYLNNLNETTYRIERLIPFTSYKIQVSAYKALNNEEGPSSNLIVVRTAEAVPGVPQDVKPLKVASNSIELEWKSPKKDELHGLIRGYGIQFNKIESELKLNSLLTDLKPVKLRLSQLTSHHKQFKYLVSNLDANSTYKFEIFAFNAKGDGARSSPLVIKTQVKLDQIQLNPIADRVTSTSALIKWNDVIKIRSLNSDKSSFYSYRLEYYLKLQPNSLNMMESLNKSEVLLTNLKSNSVYVVQLTIVNEYSNSNNNENDSDDAELKQVITITFKTLMNDIPEPKSLTVTRYEADKVNVKWDPIASSTPIKAYRIYFSEYSPSGDYNWEPIDKQMNENTQTDINIQQLNSNKDYAFKVAAIDVSGNEGAESKIEVAYKLSAGGNVAPPAVPAGSKPSAASKKYQYNEQIGMPQIIEVNKIAAKSCNFIWRPPSTSQLSSKIRLTYLISHLARPKTYRDVDGSLKTVHQNLGEIVVPGREDPTMQITWSVTGLEPDTIYDFNITGIILDKTPQQQGPPVMRVIKTKRDKPASVGKTVTTEIFDDNTVQLKLGNASELNGPIGHYWIVVVPNADANRYMETFERDLTFLAKSSLNNATSNETAYIAAEYDASAWPVKFYLGDGYNYGRFNNRPLVRGIDYKVYVIAFTDETYSSKTNGNRVSLGEVLDQKNTVPSTNKLLIGDLYTASQYSEIFNTKPIESKPITSGNDYQNFLWIAGAISGIIFILILIAIVSLHIMHKKRKSSSNGINGNGTHARQTIVTSSTSSASPTTQLLINSNQIIATNSSSSTTTTTNTNTLKYNNTNTLGLLTTATPVHNNNNNNNVSVTLTPSHNYNASNHSESLYTSIDTSQRQHLLGHHNHNAYNSHYNQQPVVSSFQDNTNTSLNSFLPPPPPLPPAVNTTGTLSSTSNYDPVELRRLQHQTVGMQSHPPIKIEDLGMYIESLKLNQNEKFSAEYESIEPGQQFTWEHSTLDYNRHKNRYANVIAYDHSRVVLNQVYDQLGSDYINANFIDGYRKRNGYIATQGPLPSTFADFWRMIWEQNSSTIVMMTKLEERNRLKCDQYWPLKGTEVYGNLMQVTLVDYFELATYSVRTLALKCLNSNEITREIKLFQYTAWPDNGVPEHSTSVLMFIRRIHNANPAEAGPMVVHCSAGVGRTGCFIVIDTMLERLRYEKTIDIYGHVTCLRSQRNYMIQTEEQYIFCYDSVLEAIQSGYTDIPVRNLYLHLEKLLQTIDENCTLTEMELEYKRLTNIKAPQSKFLSANMPANKFKNRLVNILPYETTRVCLSMLPLSNQTPQHQTSPMLQNNIEGSDYINANFIDGYKYKRAYIATQAPLNETIDDFWRMLWEHNSTIIVMLTKLREMGREKCAQYWPSERSIRYQYFVVDPIAEYNMSQYILREFKVTDARDGQSRTIRQFQYVDWPEQGVPKSGESIIELIGQVHKTKEQFGQTGPITCHCSAGVGRTGVFITLSVVLERMRYEGMIDVFNTVKMLRTQRPAMVQTEDQYQFCYRAALEYLGSFDNYET